MAPHSTVPQTEAKTRSIEDIRIVKQAGTNMPSLVPQTTSAPVPPLQAKTAFDKDFGEVMEAGTRMHFLVPGLTNSDFDRAGKIPYITLFMYRTNIDLQKDKDNELIVVTVC